MREPRGFTLLELMIVVAVIGILAAIVIPNWASSARNRKYDPEIGAMFAELGVREEQYKSEQGAGLYIAAAQCPATPTPNGADWNASCNAAAGFTTLRATATDSKILCTYTITVGCAGATCTVNATPSPPGGFAAAPATLVGSWYFILATCDMDASGGTNATFLTTSWDSSQQKQNYGL